MAEEQKSLLYKLKPITDRLPAVTKPEGHVHFRTKMMWVILVLILYFAMTNIMIYGLDRAGNIDLWAQYRTIFAGAQFSLMHLGIGPIVTGSIIMQLFTGAKIIKLNLKDPEDKAMYQGTQKFLVIIMIFVESTPQVFGFMEPSSKFIGSLEGVLPFMTGEGLAKLIIILQLFGGSYLVFMMDEVVSKWGIGSGVSLFIAAGVSQAIFTGTLNWHPVSGEEVMSLSNPPAGTLPKIIYQFTHFSTADLSAGGYEQIFLAPPNPLIALLGTIAIFFFVTYAESSRIELPLAHGGARGARGRYPIKLIYASNIAVILMAALLANVSMFSMLFWQHPSFENWPILGHNWMLGFYADDPQGGQLQVMGGLAYYLSTVNGVNDWLLPLLSDSYLPLNTETGEILHTKLQIGVHVIAYFGVMVVGSILFAKFWIETTNMGPEAVASQIESSGMQIPGFRRDPRVLRRVLERYIPVVTVISGATVGVLAAGADLIGTVGNASGTGVLLCVGIIINFYEAVGREQMMEMHPVLRGFFGGE